MRILLKISAICLVVLSFIFSLPALAKTSTTEVLQRSLSSLPQTPFMDPKAKQLAARCVRWRRVCRKRCVRWISRGGARACWLCSRYANLRARATPIGRLVTCHSGWKSRAERQGWHCVPRVNPRSVSSRGRHCVTWRHQCRYVCARWR